jgi:pSer/pThr/pTyr-binding forkhead associated (FHA) protein
MSSAGKWQLAKLIALREDIKPVEKIIESDVCTIGRSPTCQVVIPDKIVSRLHARIELDEGRRYILHDTNSANGTFINGQRIRDPHLLRDGD